MLERLERLLLARIHQVNAHSGVPDCIIVGVLKCWALVQLTLSPVRRTGARYLGSPKVRLASIKPL